MSKIYIGLLVAICLLGIGMSALADANDAGTNPDNRLVVMSYNIHIGKGLDGGLDLQRIANVINSVDPDLVSLQEVDRGVRRTGKVDQAQELARMTGMQMEFARAINFGGGEYGNAVLSKYPILNSQRIALPGSHDRCAIMATIDVSKDDQSESRQVLFVGTHLDHLNKDDRLVSIDKIEKLIESRAGYPAVLAGDINATPSSEEMSNLRKSWINATEGEDLLTFRADKPDRQIDYIMCRPASAWNVIQSRIIDESVASDHRPIVSVLELVE